MASASILVLAALCLWSCNADIDVNDYLYWKKADINAWHQYFPLRVLEEERLTTEAATAAVNSLSSGLNNSLNGVVAFQKQELETAQLLMAGTDAEGCVQGISDYMTTAINAEISTYSDCAADALSKLGRLNTSLAQIKSDYLAVYQRALKGIDVCARTYPNKGSINRLISCVDAMVKNYLTSANLTQNALFPSPSMTYFQQTVIECASTASQAVAAKGSHFLDMLLECAVLSGTVDIPSYTEELKQWKGYIDTLASQTSDSQTKNYYQVYAVEETMKSFYAVQKQAMDTYVIDTKDFAFYQKVLYSLLSDYYNTVTETSIDNPGDASCADVATSVLNAIADKEANRSLSCATDIVGTTEQLISEVNSTFLHINELMPSIGNAAILQCFSQGYVFAPNTIADCFNLVYSGFDIEYTDSQAVVVKDVNIIANYLNSSFSGSDLPCGGSSLKRLYLAADRALYNLQRCLYITSGTNYAVTTPATYTTSSYSSTPFIPN